MHAKIRCQSDQIALDEGLSCQASAYSGSSPMHSLLARRHDQALIMQLSPSVTSMQCSMKCARQRCLGCKNGSMIDRACARKLGTRSGFTFSVHSRLALHDVDGLQCHVLRRGISSHYSLWLHTPLPKLLLMYVQPKHLSQSTLHQRKQLASTPAAWYLLINNKSIAARLELRPPCRCLSAPARAS